MKLPLYKYPSLIPVNYSAIPAYRYCDQGDEVNIPVPGSPNPIIGMLYIVDISLTRLMNGQFGFWVRDRRIDEFQFLNKL